MPNQSALESLPKIALVLSFFFVTLFSTNTQANTIYVDINNTNTPNGLSWSTAFNDLQAGINAASAGDDVWVSQGTHSPLLYNSFSMKSGVKIYGGFTATETILSQRNWKVNVTAIQGYGSNVIINTNVDANALLDGFTVQFGGAGSGGGGSINGGGMNNENSSPVINNVIFTGNVASGGDGAGMYNNASSPTITNCTFDNNQCNTGDGNGGGMANNNGSSPTITNVIFTNNSVKGGIGGGGMSNDNFSSPIITKVVFSGNSSSGRGGGMYNHLSAPIITNTVFVMNTASNSGGAIHNDSSAPHITNATIAGNTCPSGYGGGVANDSGASPIITNAVFWENDGISGDDFYNFDSVSLINITYSFIAQPVTGTGNLAGSHYPFVGYYFNPAGADGIFMTVDDNLELSTCSNALNSGSNTANSYPDDITNESRIYNSIIDMGAYELQNPQTAISLASANVTALEGISLRVNDVLAPGCQIIAEVLPNGSNPLQGGVMFSLWIDSSVQTYSSQPYVQRHYDIDPQYSGAVKTANVKLFFTQQEFDAFNAVSTVSLPSGPGDAAGIANLRVMHFNGTSASGIPGTYDGSTETIDRADASIVWNNSLNRWEISFDAINFGGFSLTASGSLLPLNLISFTGRLLNGNTRLQWNTANEVNTRYFDVEKSTDGTNFNFLTKVIANATAYNSYSAIDAQPQRGNNYYRLKMVDAGAKYSYSKITIIKVSADGRAPIVIYPNPASKQLVIQYDNGANHARINVYRVDGQKVLTSLSNGSAQTTLDVSKLAEGMYILEYSSGSGILRNKFVKLK